MFRETAYKCILGLSFLVVALFVPGIARAQVDQGTINGTVADSSGGVIPGATVTLTDNATGLTLTRSTNGSGFYSFTPIKIGMYTISVTSPNFARVVQQNIHVNVSQVVSVNVTLKPGTVAQTVTVVSTPELQTESAETGQVFSTQTINNTPLNGRNYVFIAQLTTGAAAPQQGFGQIAGMGDFTSNGSRADQNNFVLDGVDNNSNMQDFLNGATYAVLPPPDALAQFNVQTSDYSAELGRSTGATVNASIKSGTNHIHGSLFEYLENDRMNAANYFDTAGKTAFHMNQFGATLGGPIWKNKIFYFADAQGTRVSEYQPASPNNTVPTPVMLGEAEGPNGVTAVGNFSEMLNPNNTVGLGPIPLYVTGGNQVAAPGDTDQAGATPNYLSCNGALNVVCSPNAVATSILKLFPKPNQGAPNQVFNNYTIPPSAISNDTTQYDVRLDYNFSPNDQMFGRYSFDDNPRYYAPPLGILDGGGFGTSGFDSNDAKSGVFSETHFFSPSFSNEFRVGFNWLSAAYLQINNSTDLAAQYGLGGIPFGPALGGFPEIGFGGFINGIGVPSYMPSWEKQNVLEILDNVSKQWGRHTVKVGVEFQHVRFYGLQPPNAIGNEQFNGTYTDNPANNPTYDSYNGNSIEVTGSGVADFLLDDMNNSTLNTVTPITNLRWYDAAYIQDDWRVTPRLAVNLGLRWEYTQPLEALNNMQANFIGNYVNNNQGTGTYLIPESERTFPMSPTLLQYLAADNIAVQYTSNNSLVNSYFNNFAPRIGVAYSLDNETVIRAGFGLFYGGQENVGLGLNLANNAPFFVTASFLPSPNVCYDVNGTVTCPTNGETLETGFGAAASSATALADAAGIGTVYSDLQNDKTAVTAAYNLSWQRMLSRSTTFTISYQGNQSKHLRDSYQPNVYLGAFPLGGNSLALQPFHDFFMVAVANEGIARYDSLQTKIDRRYSNGLYFLAGYTWAHCLDDAIGPIGQSEVGGYRNPGYLGFRYDYGPCAQDVRNRFTFSPQYDLPFGVGRQFLNRSGILNEIAGGWTTSFVFQAQTGNPIFVNSTNQGESYPNRIGNPYAPGGTDNPVTQPGFVCATKTKTIAQWFNPCAFENPPEATLGPTNASANLINYQSAGLIPFGPYGRQPVVGPGFWDLDMSLFKSFAIPYHDSSLQLRADAFNLLNHPSFGNPGSGLSGGNSQAINSTRFEGASSGVQQDQRVLQMSVDLKF